MLFCGVLLSANLKPASLSVVFVFPYLWSAPNSAAYTEAARLHSFHYLLDWRWYEWLGIIAPLAILYWLARTRQQLQMQRVCRALFLFGTLCFAAAIMLSLSGNQSPLARFQPLRGLHLLYLFLFLLMGGLCGEFLLKHHFLRWAILFVPLCSGMFIAQRTLFPASPHIEWPGNEDRNPWARGFLWARDHTEITAKFALDPNYLNIPREDTLGFRAIAERSKLSDAGKDSGEVSMFPNLAERWWNEVQAQKDWQNFSVSDFHRLKNNYGVSWVILQNRSNLDLACPYRNEAIMVCHLD